jgi:uncharacterized lipoprotein YddW (UPF0748 family)
MQWALLLLQWHLAWAGAPTEAERLEPRGSDVPGRLTLQGNAEVGNAGPNLGLKLLGDAYAEWRPQQAPRTDGGTLNIWARPLWPSGDQQSHTFATFKWSGPNDSYFALSQGWWEPVGRQKLYVVLSNQQFVFCFVPFTYNYTLYLPNQWTLLGVTWKAGDHGYLRLFVDGKRICERKMAFAGGRAGLAPLYLGSDRGSTVEPKGRRANMVIRDVSITPRPSTDEEMHSMYIRGGGRDRSKWLVAMTADAPTGRVSRERRVIQDEDTAWSSSKLEMQRRVERIKAAGFNVYMPCVWDGARAFFSTAIAPVSPTIRDPTDPQYDPLTYLIARAHAAGIAVHPWFNIVRHAPGSGFPQAFLAGAPPNAFNLQNAQFRDFIVALVVDAAGRYDVDGINLDYVRAIGPCTNKECLGEYFRRYGRSLLQDWAAQENGKEVASLIEWNRKLVTDIVRRISYGTRRVRPKAVLTVDTVPFDHGRLHQGLDEETWMRDGTIDAMVDMSYEDPIDIDTLDRAMTLFTPARQLVAIRNYDLFGETVADRSGDTMSDYVRLIRERWPGAGIAVYHYPHMSTAQVLSLGQGVFSAPAAPDWTH